MFFKFFIIDVGSRKKDRLEIKEWEDEELSFTKSSVYGFISMDRTKYVMQRLLFYRAQPLAGVVIPLVHTEVRENVTSFVLVIGAKFAGEQNPTPSWCLKVCLLLFFAITPRITSVVDLYLGKIEVICP